MNPYTSPINKAAFRAAHVVWYVASVIEAMLLLRFFLALASANPGAQFTTFIYSITQTLVAPFVAVFPVTYVQGSVFEWTTVLAMVVYWLIAWLIAELFLMANTLSAPGSAAELEKHDNPLK